MRKMTRAEAGRLGAIQLIKNNIERYEKNPKLCLGCSRKLEYKSKQNKFCSKSCGARFNNKRRNRRTIEKTNCLACKAIIKNKFKNKFCNFKCQHDLNWANKIKNAVETGILHKENQQGYISAKEILSRLYGRKCSICENVEWMNQPIPLILDHIDGNSSDGSLKNCRLVCGNCDMQLPTYKAKNKGKGRFSRRQRFLEGKSF